MKKEPICKIPIRRDELIFSLIVTAIFLPVLIYSNCYVAFDFGFNAAFCLFLLIPVISCFNYYIYEDRILVRFAFLPIRRIYKKDISFIAYLPPRKFYGRRFTQPNYTPEGILCILHPMGEADLSLFAKEIHFRVKYPFKIIKMALPREQGQSYVELLERYWGQLPTYSGFSSEP